MSCKLIVAAAILSLAPLAACGTGGPTATRHDSAAVGEKQRVEISGAKDDVFIRCDLPQDRAYFDLESTTLDARERAFLAEVATCMKTGVMKKDAILLTGFADKQGPKAFNRELARARADAVAKELIRHGVPSERIFVRSEGELDAIFEESERRDYDRRVALSRIESI